MKDSDMPAANLGLAQAGHCLVGKCLQNSKLCGSWQVCVSLACAKPYSDNEFHYDITINN